MIYGFKRSSINLFDRSATYNNSLPAKKWSDVMMEGSHLLPALILIPKKTRKDAGNLLLLFSEVYFITAGLTAITKSITLRPRPYVFDNNIDLGAKMSRNARFAFFSGHTSITAANCFVTAKIFSDYFPDSKWKPVIWGLAAAIPAVVAYNRVAAGKHYPSDVIAGYAVGATLGILIPELHKNLGSKLSFHPGFGGGNLVYKL